MNYQQATDLIRSHTDYGGSVDVHALAVVISSASTADAGARADALGDSAYCAGLQQGFSFGQMDDNEGLRKAIDARQGYVAVLREQRAALSASPVDAEPAWKEHRMINLPHPHESEMRVIGFVVPDDGEPMAFISQRIERIMGTSPLAASTPNPLSLCGKHCQTGYKDICHAVKYDGVTCADDECDIDSGVRSTPPAAKLSTETVDKGVDRLTEARIDWIANAHCPGGIAYPSNVKNAIREALLAASDSQGGVA